MGRGLGQEAFDPGRGAERAPDGQKFFRKKAGPFGAGARKERAQLQGPCKRERPFLFDHAGGFDRFPKKQLNMGSFPERVKREAEGLPDLGGGKGLQGLQKREKF